MDAQTFWNVIAHYNEQTWIAQIILLILMISAIVLSYMQKVQWSAKFLLGITNLFIGIGFFAWFGTEPIQAYFALPLYLFVGTLFLFESWRRKNDALKKPSILQVLLLLLYSFYPVVSILLGRSFPQMVTYIMPCPVISLSITVYAGYHEKNKLLLFLLTIWGLTGIKSILFQAYEDIILFICGLYSITLLISCISHKNPL